MRNLLFILFLLPALIFAQDSTVYKSRVVKDHNGKVRKDQSGVVRYSGWKAYTTTPDPGDTTINELMGGGLCAREITPNDGTGDFLWDSEQLDAFGAEDIDNVRIVFWYFNDSGSSPWTITPSVLTNLQGIVDSINAHGMIAIIDYHQPMMKRNNLYTPDNVERWVSHWAQVADHFSSYDSTDVVYELLNEPEYSASDPNSQMTAPEWNIMCQDAVDSIRVYDTEKYIMVTPHGWSKIEYLDDFDMPTDPYNRLLLTIHYYNPPWMIHQGVAWKSHGIEWLYNDWPNIWPFRKVLADEFQVLEDWLAVNGNPPVTIGEWGTVKGDIHTPHRYNYALGLRDFYEDMDYSWSWWDDVGSFGLYDTITDTFDDSIKDALFYDDLPAFGTYDSTVIYQSDFSSDTDGWTTFTTGGGGLSLSVVDNELWCNVTSAGTGTADVRALSPSHLATKDAIYRVTYTIRGDKSFCADKINDNFSWHNITALDGGGTYSRVYTYWMAYYTDPSNQVSFLLGGDTDDIYIQNVLIEEITFDTPPEIDYTILWSEDFDDFAVQSTLNGDTLEAHIDNFESASSTGGDDTYETAGIVDFDGSHVIESRYPIGECCLEGNGWGSTGMDWRAHITAAKESDPNPPRRLVISMNIYLDPLFENSSGFKLPALCTEKGSGWDNFTMRMMIVKYGLGNDERDPQYYSHAYWGGYGSPVETGARSKTMQPLNYFPGGEWINVSYVVDAGTLLSNNAWTEFFINGEMIGDNTGRSNREDPIRGIDTGDAQGLTYIEFTTFMGGSDASYVSPRTQYMYIDDVIVYYLDDSGDYTYPSSEGDELYLPPEANWPR